MRIAAPSSPVRVRDVRVAAVPELRDRMLEQTIRNNWERIVGLECARRSQPGGLKKGTLDVIVDNSPSLYEMTLRCSEVLAAVQACHGSAVSALRFTLGTLSAEPGPLIARRVSWDAPRPPHEEADRVDRMVEPVAGPALAGSLRRLLTKDVVNHRPHFRSRCPDAAAPDRKDS
jgi:hypothetical protein